MDTQVKRKSFNEIINTDALVLIDFSAEWCGPCKMMKPVLEDVKTTVGESVKIIKIDIDRNAQLATQYQIRGVPTFILFKDGKPVWRQSGAMPRNVLLEVIERYQ